MYKVTLQAGQIKEYKENTPLYEIARDCKAMYGSPAAEAVVNGKGTDLRMPLVGDANLSFIELNTEDGMRIFSRTLFFLLIVATKRLYPKIHLESRNTLGSALYCAVHDGTLSQQQLKEIEAYMRRLIAAKTPVIMKNITLDQAKEFAKSDDFIAEDLLGIISLLPKDVDCYMNELDGVQGAFYGHLLPTVEHLSHFELIAFEDGLVINYPETDSYEKLIPWSHSQRVNEMYQEAEKWTAMIGCNTVAKLNRIIDAGKADNIIRMAEALQEKKLVAIADRIAQDEKLKVILIAGPSSSGKTSSAQRLSVQLEVNGMQPIPISMDNYYLNREDSPRKPDGSYDFECVEAIDIPLFNEHLITLLKGGSVKLPKYNFKTGLREYRGEEMKIGPKTVLVIEGIHGLNEKLTSHVPRANKLKIYVSALSPLSLDNYNRINTTDIRLLRRMVRDSKFRSHDAETTINSWQTVREGEGKYIFPFQEDADIFFNTSLIYEPAVLKKYAEPLLKSITPDKTAYRTAQRLLTLLYLIKPLDAEAIPNNSILKEFLGGSTFKDAL